jgi:DNA-binding NarL/FixJ family response regulator
VDDEPMVLAGLRDTLEKKLSDVCRVEATDSPAEALEILADLVLEREPVAAVITDQNMPKISGDELLIRVHRTDPRIRTILLTGQASAEAVGRALNDAGLYRFISKPWDYKDLILTVKEAVLSWQKGYELETRVSMLQELQHNIRTLSQIMDPRVLAQEILAMAVQKTAATRGVLAFEDQLYFKDALGQETSSMVFPEASVRTAAETGRHLESEEIDFGDAPRPADALVVPIFRLDHALAVLYLENKTDAFDPIAIEYLRLFVEQSAIFIENALMFRRLNESAEERARALEKTRRTLSESLTYARMVHSALAPRQPEFSDHFSDHFLLYKPGKNSGGDGYRLVAEGHRVYFCVAEVTNPGLAAPFLVLLGSTQLTEIVMNKRIESVGDILYFLHQRVVQLMPELGMKFGVNIALCAYHRSEGRVRFSGAVLPVIHLHSAGYDVYPTDPLPLGMNDRDEGTRLFLEGEIYVQSGDRLILATDSALKHIGAGKLHDGAHLLARFVAETRPHQSVRDALAQRFFSGENEEDVLVLGITV